MSTQEIPSAVGLDPERWHAACRLLQGWCDRGDIPAAGIIFGRNGKTTGAQILGRQTTAADSPPIRQDAIFLIASITKPIVASGILLLAERGQLVLDDRVETYVPEFGQNGKHGVTIRHLLTHTSGLPDMLDNNLELRKAGAPLKEFVAGTCLIPLAFPPGRGVQYQSMGILMLGEIILRITGKTCPQFLHDEFFQPLGMEDTALGAPDDWFTGKNPKANRIAELRLPADMQGDTSSWNWNSRYWRQLGSPWGGLLTTPNDLARFAKLMLNEGAVGKKRILSAAAVRAATRSQLEFMKELPSDDRRCRPWGFGWRMNWPSHSANFGDFLGPRAYGHWGATGTVMWIDPDTQSYFILFTTQPQEPQGGFLARMSNAVLAAMV